MQLRTVCVFLVLVWALETDGLVHKPSRSSLAAVQTREEFAGSSAKPDQMTTVAHQKEAGGLYKAGSPKYNKQEELRDRGELPKPDRLQPHQIAGSGEEKATGKSPAPSQRSGGAVTSDDGRYTAKFDSETMPKVSPTVKNVINLACQYFIIYTALAIVRTMNEFSAGGNKDQGGPQDILQAACTTVAIAPMLCILFIGTRMRAIQLTDGDTEKYELPQPWVQTGMWVASMMVLLQTIVVILVPVLGGRTKKDETTGEMVIDSGAGGAAVALTTVQAVALLALAISCLVVVVGVFTMKAPAELWKDYKGGEPPVSPALQCTMWLVLCYFIVYIVCAIARSMRQFNPRTDPKLETTFTMAKYTMNMAPMLCILFIGARMRALQIDPKTGSPQPWAQNCFTGCTIGVVGQVCMVVLMPYMQKGVTVNKSGVEGDWKFEGIPANMAAVVTTIRYVFLLAVHVCFTLVMISVFTIKNEEDVDLTPPVSPAMLCVMNLVVQFFVVYLILFIAVTVRQFAGGCEFLISLMEGAAKTVQYAAMLSVLFIACRMRALQLTRTTDNKVPPSAGPQPWAQQGMFLSTWSVLVQVILAILVPLALGGGKKDAIDDEGNVKVDKNANQILGIVLTVIKYLCLLAMYGGVIAVMWGIHTMTPETLPPYNAKNDPLVAGLPPVSSPPSPETPGTQTTTTTNEYKPAWGAKF